MTQEEKIKEIIKISDTNQLYDVVDFNALHESLHEDLMEMATWKEEQLIDKACEWLRENVNDYIFNDGKEWMSDWKVDIKEMLDDFKKAMMEE